MKKLTALFVLLFIAVTFSAKADKIDDIIAKNIKAHGGEKAMKEMKSSYVEMEMNMMGMAMPMKSWMKGTDKMRVEVSVMGQNTITVQNGKKMWVKAGGKTKELTPEEMAAQETQNLTSNPVANNILLDYKANGFVANYKGTENIEGKTCDVIELVQDTTLTMYWYIDQATGLEAQYSIKMPKMEEGAEEGGFPMPEKIDIVVKEFMTVDGIVIAKTYEMNIGMIMTVTVKKAEFNKPIDDKLFEKP